MLKKTCMLSTNFKHGKKPLNIKLKAMQAQGETTVEQETYPAFPYQTLILLYKHISSISKDSCRN